MIPTIGIMIAFYIVTRMVQILVGEDEIMTKLFAGITLVATIVLGASLVLSSNEVSRSLNQSQAEIQQSVEELQQSLDRLRRGL